MLKYVAIRVATWAPTLLLILLGVYAIAFFGAGDPVKLMFVRAPGDVAYDPARIEAIREAAGLDKPFLEQFWRYITSLLQGNWGNSLINDRPVWSAISAAAPVSFQLGVTTIIVTALVAIPLGIISALNQNNKIDYTILTTALVMWAIPPYVAGPILMVAAISLAPLGLTLIGWGGIFDVRFILPLIVLSLHPIALVTRQTRAAVIEVMSEDYIRTAYAKGLPSGLIAYKHLTKPVLVPVFTQLGLILISLVNGAMFVELIFGIPGLGRLAVMATIESDYPVILGVTLIGAVLVMVANLLVDLAYPLLDPRSKVSRS